MTQPGGGEPLLKITLTDSDSTSYDFILEGGDSSIVETFDSPQPVTPGGTGKYGDFEPGFGFIEQRDWSRGRGQEDFSDDPARFYDSSHMWTATDKRLYPAPTYQFSSGINPIGGNDHSPNPSWLTSPFIGSGTGYWYAGTFTPGASFTAVYVDTWFVQENDYSDLTVTCGIYSDSTGEPGTLLSSATNQYTESSLLDGVFKHLHFEFSGQSLTGSTTYWVVFKVDTGTDSHVLAHILDGEDNGKISTDSGSNWSTVSGPMFRIYAEKPTRRVQPFEWQGALFALAMYYDGTNSKLYINGDRGKATSATSTTIVDTNEGLRGAWTSNQWTNGYVIIVGGKGKGQSRKISSNDTSGSITVSSAWDITPDTTSFYVIRPKLDDWYEIGSTGLSDAKGVVVTNNIAYFYHGYGSTLIRRARWNDGGSPPAMQFADDGSNDADVMWIGNGYIYAATNDDGVGKYANVVSWGTALTFTNLDRAMGIGSDFTNIRGHGSYVYFFKEDKIFYIAGTSTSPLEYSVDIDSYRSVRNCETVCSHGEYLYFNWVNAMNRISGMTVDLIDPARGAGLPTGRNGVVSAMASHPAGLFFAIDAGNDGVSSINIWDGLGFHDLFHLEDAEGQRIRDLYWYSPPDINPRLYFSIGDDLAYMEFPKHHTSPIKAPASDWYHMWTCELITSTIDMGSKGLKKLFKDVVVITRDLLDINPTYFGEGRLFYQYSNATTDQIGTDTWTDLGYFYTASRENTGFSDPTLSTINALGNIHEIRFKLVMRDKNNSLPIIEGMTLKAFGRTPTKIRWSFPVAISEPYETLGAPDPSTIMTWLEDKAEDAEALLMTSEHPRLHNQTVIIVPRSLRTTYIDYSNESFAGVMFLEVRQA